MNERDGKRARIVAVDLNTKLINTEERVSPFISCARLESTPNYTIQNHIS